MVPKLFIQYILLMHDAAEKQSWRKMAVKKRFASVKKPLSQ